jgi:transcriptional regulator with XRE-family HTH domain
VPRKRNDWFLEEEERLGKVVRQQRRDRGWSQADMATALKAIGWPLHQTTISKIEAAKQPIRVADLLAFATAFGMPAVALFSLPTGDEPRGIQKMREQLEDAEQEMTRAYHDLISAAATHALAMSIREQTVREIGQAGPSDLTGTKEETRK